MRRACGGRLWRQASWKSKGEWKEDRSAHKTQQISFSTLICTAEEGKEATREWCAHALAWWACGLRDVSLLGQIRVRIAQWSCVHGSRAWGSHMGDHLMWLAVAWAHSSVGERESECELVKSEEASRPTLPWRQIVRFESLSPCRTCHSQPASQEESK